MNAPVEVPGDRREHAGGWGLVAAAAVPFVVVLVGAVRARWVPSFDIALTQMRVRDVFSRHPPLIGVPGRFYADGERGSHPGPAALYLLAPVHRLGGQTPTALLVATVVLNAAGAVGAVAIVWLRRRSVAATALAVVLVTTVTAAMGSRVALYPWLPSLAVWLWVLCLGAMVCVLAGDSGALPIAVFGAVAAAQTHVSYAPVAVVAVAVGAVCARADRRALWRSGVVLGVTMLPVVVDQLFRSGNLGLLVRSLRADAAGPRLGWTEGTRVLLQRLDPIAVVGGGTTDGFAGSAVLGAASVTAWLTLVAVGSVRSGGDVGRPSWFDIGLGCYLVAGWLATVRIQGVPWPYLTLWTAPLAVLLVARTGALVATMRSPRGAQRVLLAAALIAAVFAAVSVADVYDDEPQVTAAVSAVAPDVVGALRGVSGPVVIESYDERDIGAVAIALALEAERAGVPLVFPEGWEVDVRAHRVVAADRPPQHVLIVATGSWADRWAGAHPDHVAAEFDPRTAAQLADGARLQRELAAALCADVVAPTVQPPNLLAIVLGEIDVGPAAAAAAGELLGLPALTSVLLLPTADLSPAHAVDGFGEISC